MKKPRPACRNTNQIVIKVAQITALEPRCSRVTSMRLRAAWNVNIWFNPIQNNIARITRLRVFENLKYLNWESAITIIKPNKTHVRRKQSYSRGRDNNLRFLVVRCPSLCPWWIMWHFYVCVRTMTYARVHDTFGLRSVKKAVQWALSDSLLRLVSTLRSSK